MQRPGRAVEAVLIDELAICIKVVRVAFDALQNRAVFVDCQAVGAAAIMRPAGFLPYVRERGVLGPARDEIGPVYRRQSVVGADLEPGKQAFGQALAEVRVVGEIELEIVLARLRGSDCLQRSCFRLTAVGVVARFAVYIKKAGSSASCTDAR